MAERVELTYQPLCSPGSAGVSAADPSLSPSFGNRVVPGLCQRPSGGALVRVDAGPGSGRSLVHPSLLVPYGALSD